MANISETSVLAVLQTAGGTGGMTITEVTTALGADARTDKRALKAVRDAVRVILASKHASIVRNPHGDLHVRAVELATHEPTNSIEWRQRVDVSRWPVEIVRVCGDEQRVVALARDEGEALRLVGTFVRGYGELLNAVFFSRKRQPA